MERHALPSQGLKTMAINARWHEAHRMPRGAKLAERVLWHAAHAKACGCREMPASIRAALAPEAKSAGASKVSARAKPRKRAKKRAAK